MDRNLQAILEALRQIQASNISYRQQQQELENSKASRERTEFLNDFHHVVLPPYQHNEIEPIPDWDVPYGEREPYQEVKAHLISQNSKRISSSSKSVDDYRIENKGALSIDPLSLDKKYHDVREAYNLNEKEDVLAAEQERIEKEIKEVKYLVEITLTTYQESFSYYYNWLVDLYKNENFALWLSLIKFCSWLIKGEREPKAFELVSSEFRKTEGALRELILNWFKTSQIGDYWEGYLCSPLSEFQLNWLKTYVELK